MSEISSAQKMILVSAIAGQTEGFDEIMEKIGLSPNDVWERAAEYVSPAMDRVMEVVNSDDDLLKVGEDGSMTPAAKDYFALDAVETVKTYLRMRGQDEEFERIISEISNIVAAFTFTFAKIHDAMKPLHGSITISVTSKANNENCLQFLVYPKGSVIWKDGQVVETTFDDNPAVENAIAISTAYGQSIYAAIMRGIADAVSNAALRVRNFQAA